MTLLFRDRTEAGERLAEVLALYRHPSPIVLALSREAIPIAAVVAEALGSPHDLLLPRAIGPAKGETERMVSDLAGKSVILIDDALRSDGDARAAIRGARTLGAARVIVAAPIGIEEVIESLCADADEVVCVHAPEEWDAASSHYAHA